MKQAIVDAELEQCGDKDKGRIARISVHPMLTSLFGLRQILDVHCDLQAGVPRVPFCGISTFFQKAFIGEGSNSSIE